MAKIIKEGLTFDDVLLIPQKSEILPKEIDTKTHLTNVPFCTELSEFQLFTSINHILECFNPF